MAETLEKVLSVKCLAQAKVIRKTNGDGETNGDGTQYFRSSSFIYYTVNRSLKAITHYASGSTFKEVSGTVLKTVKVCLPASDVVEQFTNKVDSIFKRQDVLEQENQQLTQLRDWLLPLLLNGQVTVALGGFDGQL
jgi:hypothetical protein